jgi:hypothetical protein
MSILIIGNQNISEKISGILKTKNLKILCLSEFERHNFENIIQFQNITHIIDLNTEFNHNYFKQNKNKSEVALSNMKKNYHIIEKCIEKNIKLIYFNNINRIENKYTIDLLNLISTEKNLHVNIINYGDILYSSYNNSILDSIQHISKSIIYSKNKTIINTVNLNKNFYFNLDSDIISDIDNILKFEGKYRIINYSKKLISLIDVTKEIIELSGKEIKLIDQDNNEYKNKGDIEQLNQHLKNIVSQVKCQLEIDTLNLTSNEIKEIETILKSLDSNKDGTLAIKDLSNMLKILNMNVDQNKFFSIYENADKNKDGVIDKQEFILLMKNKSFSNNSENNGKNNIDDDDIIFG